MKLGPVASDQLRRFGATWKQGEHVLVSGATGSGKTILARQVYNARIQRGGFVVVMVCKLREDRTITDEYKGWTRWEEWKKNPSPHENKVLLWPKTDKLKTMRDMRNKQREVFGHAFDSLAKTGKWTLGVDEGLYTCSPQFLNLSEELAMLHALGRSSKLTVVTLMQRPANVPLIVYGSASHAFVGRTREAADLKRLAELNGRETSRALSGRLAELGRHDFLWVPVATDGEPEKLNLKH